MSISNDRDRCPVSCVCVTFQDLILFDTFLGKRQEVGGGRSVCGTGSFIQLHDSMLQFPFPITEALWSLISYTCSILDS